MSITIEEGKFYRTRDGQKVGPMVPGLGKTFNTPNSFSSWGWYSDGHVNTAGQDHPVDLVAEWPDDPPSPVRTVTKKEIVPGQYGRVLVGGESGDTVAVHLRHPVDVFGFNPAELRAAAKVFLDLADALEEQE